MLAFLKMVEHGRLIDYFLFYWQTWYYLKEFFQIEILLMVKQYFPFRHIYVDRHQLIFFHRYYAKFFQ